jgi:hypothetical protein
LNSLKLFFSGSFALYSPLLGTILLPLVRALVVVCSVAQLPKLPTGPGFQNGLERSFERFPGVLGASLCLARQDLDRHIAHLLVVVDASLLSEGSPQVAKVCGPAKPLV